MKFAKEYLDVLENSNAHTKYEITDIQHPTNPKLKRIRALKNFGRVKKGDLGGWIESEKNLSQDGNCWVYDNARVYGDAGVFGNAQVYGNAVVFDNAEVYGDAQVYGNARVFGNAEVFGDAQVYDNAQVFGNAK